MNFWCAHCGENLVATSRHTHECPRCRISYSNALLRDIPDETWRTIAMDRLLCFECGTPTAPVVKAGSDGQPIACPEHGPAPAFWSRVA